MEFNFHISKYFPDEITKVGSRLIPDGFYGDKRELQDCITKVSYILTVLGEKSAYAQGLQKVITSGEKLRNSDHVVYILTDPNGGSRGFGTVVGMLKIGVKHLYVFDAGGKCHEVTTKCVLDFYVHESKQRMGLGKKLFQHMLKEESVDPVHLAIDRPSSKFLSFLLKHYNLETVIPQMNNFVVFDGFFNDKIYGDRSGDKDKALRDGKSIGSRCASELANHVSSSSLGSQFQTMSSLTLNQGSYYGRQAAHKPVSTMGMILQHKSAVSQSPPANGSKSEEVKQTETEVPTLKVEEIIPESEDKNENETENLKTIPEAPTEPEPEKEVDTNAPIGDSANLKNNNNETPSVESPTESLKTPSEAPNDKIRLNSQGYMDLKFYHANLW